MVSANDIHHNDAKVSEGFRILFYIIMCVFVTHNISDFKVLRGGGGRLRLSTYPRLLLEGTYVVQGGLIQFLQRLSTARYDCLPDVNISHAFKNDASNSKKKQISFPDLV